MVERDRQVTLGSNAFRLLRIAVEGANAVWVAFRRAVARFRNDEDGMYLVYLTAAMPVLLGFVSLGSEAGSLFYAKQSLQAAADSAAVSAATAYGANAPINTEAYAIAAQYGFVNNTNGVIVHAYQPPQSGPYSGNSNAVEVTVSRPQAPLFSSDWISQPFAVSATAVAVLANGGDCVLALDPTAQKAVQASGSAAVIMTNCGLFSDSDASTSNNPSILVSGGAKFTAQSVGAVGTVCSAGGTCPPPASLMTPTPTTGDKSISNPYASVAMPTYSGCNSTNYSPDTNQTLTPVGGVYVFCGNVNIGGSNKVTLNTGTYIVNGGSFSVSGSATLTSAGADVTLVFTSGATANISGALNLTAPDHRRSRRARDVRRPCRNRQQQ